MCFGRALQSKVPIAPWGVHDAGMAAALAHVKQSPEELPAPQVHFLSSDPRRLLSPLQHCKSWGRTRGYAAGSSGVGQALSDAFILMYKEGFPSPAHFFWKIKANLNSAPVEIKDLFSILTFSTQNAGLDSQRIYPRDWHHQLLLLIAFPISNVTISFFTCTHAHISSFRF